MTDVPGTFARIENTLKSYLTPNYEIIMERQRPTVAKLILEEPIDSAQMTVLSLGSKERMFRKCALRIEYCRELSAKRFECLAVEPLRDILDAPYARQGTRETLTETLTLMMKTFNLSVINQTKVSPMVIHNLTFLSTVRNALDQIHRIYNLDAERWYMDLFTSTFYLLPGEPMGPPFELDMRFFVEENSDGIESEIVANMKPFVPFSWRGEIRLVDWARFDGLSNHMTVSLADPVSTTPL